jgi:hypothetical protein
MSESELGLLELVEGLRDFQDRFGCDAVGATYRHRDGTVVTLRLARSTDGTLLTISDDHGNEYVVRMKELAE